MSNQLFVNYESTDGTPYAVIRRGSDSFVWDGSGFVVYMGADIADYDVALTNEGDDYWSADFPSDIEGGGYRVSYYERIGASPTTDDLLLTTDEITWNGASVDPGLPPTTQGRYISDVSLKQYGGVLNVAISSQQDPESVSGDAANIAAAIVYAEDKADSELAPKCKISTGVGMTWESVALLTSGSANLSLIQEDCHRLAMRKLNVWRMVQSLSPEQSADKITASEEVIALKEFADWRANPAKLYEVDKVADYVSPVDALSALRGLVPARGKLNCPPYPCITDRTCC